MLLVALLTTTIVEEVDPIAGGFDAQCTDDDDHGWPRFSNLTALKSDSAWASYFTYVYGELPTRFPVCIYDLHALDAKALAKFSVNKTGQLPPPKAPTNPGKYPAVWPELKAGDLFESGQTGYQIFHEKWEPVPVNGWVEVRNLEVRSLEVRHLELPVTYLSGDAHGDPKRGDRVLGMAAKGQRRLVQRRQDDHLPDASRPGADPRGCDRLPH